MTATCIDLSPNTIPPFQMRKATKHAATGRYGSAIYNTREGFDKASVNRVTTPDHTVAVILS
jgi:hypothetical protein